MQWSGRSSQTPLWDGTCSPTVLLVPAGTIDGGTAETACSWTGADELSRGHHHHCSPAGEGPFIPRPEGRGLLAQESQGSISSSPVRPHWYAGAGCAYLVAKGQT